MDKFFRAVFVALAVGFAWGIRGHFGHLIGAMFPGAMLGLGFAYVSGQKAMFRWAPILGTIGGLGIAIGGYTSYGILHGYAQSGSYPGMNPSPSDVPMWVNTAYGFLMLALQGGCWGTFGCAGIGAILDEHKPSVVKFLELIAFLFFFGWLFQFVMTVLVGFHVNPPRSDAVLGHIGATAALFVWLAWNRYKLALRGAFLGFGGFGMGMILGRLLANVFQNLTLSNPNLAPEALRLSINHWNIMEITVGLVGGFVFTLGMIGKKVEERPNNEGYPFLSVMSIFYVLGMIPLLHLFVRTNWKEELKKMTGLIEGWKTEFPNIAESLSPEKLISQATWLADAVVAIGWVAALVWLVISRKNWSRLSWFPVLALGAVVSFLDLFLRLYFRDPRLYCISPETTAYQYYFPGFFLKETMLADGLTKANVLFVEMRTVSMGLFVLMVLYVILRETVWPHTPLLKPDEKMERIPWIRWVATFLLVYAAVVYTAGYTNGAATMRNANTRWPLWTAGGGKPFPGDPEDVKKNVSPP